MEEKGRGIDQTSAANSREEEESCTFLFLDVWREGKVKKDTKGLTRVTSSLSSGKREGSTFSS